MGDFKGGEFVEFGDRLHVVHGQLSAVGGHLVMIERDRQTGLDGGVRTLDMATHAVRSAIVARYNDGSLTRCHVIAPIGAPLVSLAHDEYVRLLTGSVNGLAECAS